MQLILFIWFIFYDSTCSGRSPRPSSGVMPLQFVKNYSWRWTQTASETCRVVKNKPNEQVKLHLVGIFIKLVWTLFFVLLWRSDLCSLSKHFRYTLYSCELLTALLNEHKFLEDLSILSTDETVLMACW